MSDELIINEGSTRAWIKILPTNPWAPVIRDITRSKLTDYEFNPRFKKYVINRRYLRYDDKRKVLYIPINAVPFIKDSLENIGCPYKVKKEALVKPGKTDIHMKPGFTLREKQKPIVKFLVNDNPHRKCVNLATGSGKTLCVIAAAVQMKQPCLIICSGLCEQWRDVIFKFTDAKPEDVYMIKGFKSLFDLMDSDLKPAFVIFSLETLRMYVNQEGNYADLPSFDRFQEYFEFGMCSRDEVHLNFHMYTWIDTYVRIRNNCYCSATFLSSNASTRKVFNLIYPEDLMLDHSEAQRYIRGVAVLYHGNVPEKATMRQRGYFHIGQEHYLLKRPRLLAEYFQTLQAVIHSYYINLAEPGEKCLIYFATLEMIDYMVKQVRSVYPEYKVIAFTGGVPNSAMEQADIGITNTKRAGTGTDIKMLRTVISTISLKGECLITQLRGRLRKLESGNTPVYVEMVDLNNWTQRRHYQIRKFMHKQACLTFEEQPWN